MSEGRFFVALRFIPLLSDSNSSTSYLLQLALVLGQVRLEAGARLEDLRRLGIGRSGGGGGGGGGGHFAFASQHLFAFALYFLLLVRSGG